MDEKKILLELRRISQLMKLENNHNKRLFLEQDNLTTALIASDLGGPIAGAAVYGMTSSKLPTFNIGKGTDYPFIFEIGNDEVDTLPVVEGTKVYLFKDGFSADDIFSDVKVGTVIDDTGTEHTDQEYLEEEGEYIDKETNQLKTGTVKYCLPDSTFWEETDIIGKVYKFEVPVRSEGGLFKSIQSRTETFAMGLQLIESTTGPDGKTITGSQASMACRGGANGWGWVRTAPLFTNPEDGKQYNPKDPQDLDTRSDFGVFYDHYGMWLEVGLGVAASLIGMGAASLLITLSSRIKWLGYVIRGLGLMGKYGKTTWLSVVLQIVAEAGLMLPIVNWQIDEGKYTDAVLSSMFLLLPFVTEAKWGAKYVSGKYGREVSESLAKKIQSAGIDEIFRYAKEIDPVEASRRFNLFLNNLDSNEVELFEEGLKILSKKEGVNQIIDGFTRFMEKSGGEMAKVYESAKSAGKQKTILGNMEKILGKEETSGFVKTLDKIGQHVGVHSKWIVPGTVIRIGGPLAIFQASLKSAYNALTEEEKLDFQQKFEQSVYDQQSYFKKLHSIDPYLAEQVLNTQLEKVTESESSIDNLIKSSDEFFTNTEEGKKIAQESINEVYEKRKNVLSASLKKELMPVVIEVLADISAFKIIVDILEDLGFKNVNATNMDNLEKIKGTCLYQNKKYEFETNKTQIYVGGKLITSEELKNETWESTGANTIN